MPLRGLVRITLFVIALMLTCSCWAEQAGTNTPAASPPASTPAPSAPPPSTPTPSTPTPSAPATAAKSPSPVDIEADHVTVDLPSGSVRASGNVQTTADENTFYADQANYIWINKNALLDKVHGVFDVQGPQQRLILFYYHAEKVAVDSKQVKHVYHAVLSTCSHDHPHYALVAREMVVYPDHSADIKGIWLEYGGHPLFPIPNIHQRFTGDSSGQGNSFPLEVGHGNLDGYYLGMHYAQMIGSSNIDVSARFGTNDVVRGGLYLTTPIPEHLGLMRGTADFVTTYREDVTNRMLGANNISTSVLQNLTVSRLPAADVKFNSIPMSGSLTGSHVQLGGGIGNYYEQPTDVQRIRAQVWGILRSPDFFRKGPVWVNGQIGDRVAFYGNSEYNTFAAQITAESAPTLDAYYNVSLLHRTANGFTPFLFDRVLIPDELYTAVEIPIAKHGAWRIGAMNRQDLVNELSRDYGFSLIYCQDCLSYGLSYDRAAQAFSFHFTINALRPPRHDIGGIGFTQ